jgi:hypothetical protein
MCIVSLAGGVPVSATDNITPAPAASAINPQMISVPPEIYSGAANPAPAIAQKSAQSRANYNCWLRVYIMEPVSRWKDYNNKPYENTLINFGLDTALSLAYQETYQTTRTWESPLFIGDVSSDNIKVAAGVFTQEPGGSGQSDTVGGTMYPFTIHTADAAAAATPGNPGYDTAYGGYTHTVLIEKATWGG